MTHIHELLCIQKTKKIHHLIFFTIIFNYTHRKYNFLIDQKQLLKVIEYNRNGDMLTPQTIKNKKNMYMCFTVCPRDLFHVIDLQEQKNLFYTIKRKIKNIY